MSHCGGKVVNKDLHDQMIEMYKAKIKELEDKVKYAELSLAKASGETPSSHQKIAELQDKVNSISKHLMLTPEETDEAGFYGRACSRLQNKLKVNEEKLDKLQYAIKEVRKTRDTLGMCDHKNSSYNSEATWCHSCGSIWLTEEIWKNIKGCVK